MTVDSAIVGQLRQEANRLGDEICGALIGDRSRIHHATPLLNHSAHKRDSFLIPAGDVLQAEADAAAHGMYVVGFYHSHPRGSALPSTSDLQNAVPGYIYLILAADGDARAWRLRDDRTGFTEVELT